MMRSVLLPCVTVLLALLAVATMTWGKDADETELDYGAMLRALRPTMTFEVTEANMNAYLKTRPAGLSIPAGFEEPRVALTDGVFEVSARKSLLFIATRVRVGLAPEAVRGRLHLKVVRVSAGPIPLPSDFHMGVADAIEESVNAILERNEMQLIAVAVEGDALRVSAKAMPPAPPPAELEEAQ